MEEVHKISHQLIMQNRSCVELSGVLDVDTFDDSTVVAKTSFGDLSIHGQNLVVKKLDLESTQLSVEGKVNSLMYSEPTRGLFGRLLR